MTPTDAPAMLLAAIDALIRAMILAPADADAPISSADLIESILDDDDFIPTTIRTIAFDNLDLDDEMLIDRIYDCLSDIAEF